MENARNGMHALCSLRGAGESHTVVRTTVIEATQLWRQTGSLAAYHVIVSALDSNDDEIRSLAEGAVHRSSPRPPKTRPTNEGWGGRNGTTRDQGSLMSRVRGDL